MGKVPDWVCINGYLYSITRFKLAEVNSWNFLDLVRVTNELDMKEIDYG